MGVQPMVCRPHAAQSKYQYSPRSKHRVKEILIAHPNDSLYCCIFSIEIRWLWAQLCITRYVIHFICAQFIYSYTARQLNWDYVYFCKLSKENKVVIDIWVLIVCCSIIFVRPKTCEVYFVWPKTTCLLHMWPRKAKRLYTPDLDIHLTPLPVS